jgi:hypothetical protein
MGSGETIERADIPNFAALAKSRRSGVNCCPLLENHPAATKRKHSSRWMSTSGAVHCPVWYLQGSRFRQENPKVGSMSVGYDDDAAPAIIINRKAPRKPDHMSNTISVRGFAFYTTVFGFLFSSKS